VDVGGLLRQAAQKEDGKAQNCLLRGTGCASCVHKTDYTRQIWICKQFLVFFACPEHACGELVEPVERVEPLSTLIASCKLFGRAYTNDLWRRNLNPTPIKLRQAANHLP